MTDNKQIKEMPICVNCVHAYVCEEYNLDRDMLRKRCAYHNDHFLDIEQYKKKVCKETAEKYICWLKENILSWGVCGNGKIKGNISITVDELEKFSKQFGEFSKQFGVEIEE